MTVSYVYLWILYLWILSVSFSEYLFHRAPLENYLFHLQVAEFQPVDTVISQVLFKYFIQEREEAIQRSSFT